MARTSGQGNPNWTRDEVILALDLYLKSDGRVPSPADNRVLALSELLRQNPEHEASATTPSFRNADGVSFKLQNIRQVATGDGLGNTSKVDREVWDELGDRPEEVRKLAETITAAILSAPKDQANMEAEHTFQEGRVITRAHKTRERSASLRRRVLKERRQAGRLACDCCGYASPSTGDESWFEAALEVHHIKPLAASGQRMTTLSDVALLCANCHRLTHCVIAREGVWPTPEQLAERLGLR